MCSWQQPPCTCAVTHPMWSSGLCGCLDSFLCIRQPSAVKAATWTTAVAAASYAHSLHLLGAGSDIRRGHRQRCRHRLQHQHEAPPPQHSSACCCFSSGQQPCQSHSQGDGHSRVQPGAQAAAAPAATAFPATAAARVRAVFARLLCCCQPVCSCAA